MQGNIDHLMMRLRERYGCEEEYVVARHKRLIDGGGARIVGEQTLHRKGHRILLRLNDDIGVVYPLVKPNGFILTYLERRMADQFDRRRDGEQFLRG